MKRYPLRLSVALILSIFLSTSWAQDDAILVCDADISKSPSLFQWHLIEADVPLYMYPDDAEKVYQNQLNRYERNLKPDDFQRDQVKKFIKLQEDIIAQTSSGNLAIRINAMSDKTELFSGTKLVFEINCGDIGENYLIDIAYLTIAYKKIHDASYDAFRKKATLKIQQRNMQYQNWFDNGLPMWPQETWLNGLFLGESDAEEPAKSQLVFFRPSVGLGAKSGDSLSDSKLEATLGVEIGGFVHYLDNSYAKYWGISALATLGEDTGVGYGLLVRYNDFVLGFTRREKDESSGIDEDSDYLFIGYDLYKLINDNNDTFKGYKKKVRATISKFDG